MNKLRAAIIGLGHVAHHHLAAIALTPEVELVGACDCDAAKSTILPAGVPFFNNVEKMLSSLALDMVIVAVPNQMHEDVTMVVLNAGINAAVEKPIAGDLAAIESLFTLADKCRLRLIPVLHAAYGREVLWFESALSSGQFDELGNLTGFYSGFYDPYVVDGEIVSGAAGLGDSWTDSAINALSVLGRFIKPSQMRLVDLKRTRLFGVESRGVQGNGLYHIISDDGSIKGWGAVNTNWAIGLNHKSTRLFFGNAGAEVVLDHSSQTVLLHRRNGSCELLANLADGTHRLTAHYMGFFSRMVSDLPDFSMDPDYAYSLHALCLEEVI